MGKKKKKEKEKLKALQKEKEMKAKSLEEEEDLDAYDERYKKKVSKLLDDRFLARDIPLADAGYKKNDTDLSAEALKRFYEENHVSEFLKAEGKFIHFEFGKLLEPYRVNVDEKGENPLIKRISYAEISKQSFINNINLSIRYINYFIEYFDDDNELMTAQFPHYFVGSNADLPIVGGSILSHDHFQGGNYTFAMAKAPVEYPLMFAGFEDVSAGILKWPMSVIRLSAENPCRLIELADKILVSWRGYTDESAFIYAETDGEPHNTITPIARKRGDRCELDLVLRNNITTKEHPLGVFHPHAELHHIKKENIGLIEVMGLAVLPARLKTEMAQLKCAITENRDIRDDETLAKHADWVDEIKQKYSDINENNIEEILKDEIGLVFAKVLEHAGVFKRTEDGIAAFKRFAGSVK